MSFCAGCSAVAWQVLLYQGVVHDLELALGRACNWRVAGAYCGFLQHSPMDMLVPCMAVAIFEGACSSAVPPGGSTACQKSGVTSYMTVSVTCHVTHPMCGTIVKLPTQAIASTPCQLTCR
jgi:hypothetical protein